MKALTVMNPWAWAIVSGLKKVENRTRGTPHRGPLLIHAGKSRASLDEVLPGRIRVPLDQLLFGQVIGMVDLIDCLPFDELPDKIRRHPFAHGPVCWVVVNPRPIVPITIRGQQYLFDVPDELIQLA